MSLRRKISFWCYFLVGLLVAGMSMVYIFTPRILPYHERAIGVPWEELKPGFQLFLLSSLRLGGALALASSIALFILLFIPFRRGETWARWAIPVFSLPSLIALTYVPVHIALRTNANPPLAIFFIGDILFITAIIFSIGPRSK
jgi:hypothetical protein